MIIEKNNNPDTLPVDFCFDAQNNGGSLGAEIDGVSQLDFSNAGETLGQLRKPGITVEQCAALTTRLADLGVIAYLPTLVTAEPEVLEENLGRRFAVLVEGPSRRDPAEPFGRTRNRFMVVLPAGAARSGDVLPVELVELRGSTFRGIPVGTGG